MSDNKQPEVSARRDHLIKVFQEQYKQFHDKRALVCELTPANSYFMDQVQYMLCLVRWFRSKSAC